jgi:hypothetical protein
MLISSLVGSTVVDPLLTAVPFNAVVAELNALIKVVTSEAKLVVDRV